MRPLALPSAPLLRACRFLFLFFFFFFLSPLSVSAFEVVGQVLGSQELAPDFFNTRVALNDGLYTTRVTASGHFKFTGIPAGVYHLDVYEPRLKFRKYKVDVSSKKSGTIRALSKPFPGGEKKMERYPLLIQAVASEVYFKARSGANPIVMLLRNPIFLIMGVLGVLRLVAPSAEDTQNAKNPGDGAPSGASNGSSGAFISDDDDDIVDMPTLSAAHGESKSGGTAQRRSRGKHSPAP